ncbi:MAG: type II toxin-antitoxin system RatA family toxin [Alphaproteobacteria bacterium]|nr:type II toxin-antitoxin system RatA family toxin [Alphaproteobacteria bacterium]
MPVLKQTHILPYSAQQLFELVADVERYPEFLPWCRAARITSRGEGEFMAELVISFKHISERYTSRVQLFPHTRIEVNMVEGPFSHLVNNWDFELQADGSTKVEFFLDFGFRSRLLGAMIGPIFGSAAEKMADAFETRARGLYQPLKV